MLHPLDKEYDPLRPNIAPDVDLCWGTKIRQLRSTELSPEPQASTRPQPSTGPSSKPQPSSGPVTNGQETPSEGTGSQVLGMSLLHKLGWSGHEFGHGPVIHHTKGRGAPAELRAAEPLPLAPNVCTARLSVCTTQSVDHWIDVGSSFGNLLQAEQAAPDRVVLTFETEAEAAACAQSLTIAFTYV